MGEHGDPAAKPRGSHLRGRGFALVGLCLLGYAVLGNYVALPGYRRFLERGGRSASGNTLDLSVAIGAAKTVLWMFSFQLGAFCLAYAALLAAEQAARGFRRWFAFAAVGWLSFWALPRLPEPSSLYFALVGCCILGLTGAVFWRARQPAPSAGLLSFESARGFRICSYLFFALATWEVCGLGSVGRILHPGEIEALGTRPLIVTQTTKLIIELALAWLFALLATYGPPWLPSGYGAATVNTAKP